MPDPFSWNEHEGPIEGEVRRHYTNMSEVPADELGEWIAHHCMTCGTPLVQLIRQWRVTNNQWAEEATLEELDYWREQTGAETYEEVRELICQGLLSDAPPFFVVTPGIQTAFTQMGAEQTHNMCGDCFADVFEQAFEEGISAGHKESIDAVLSAVATVLGVRRAK